MGELEFVFSDKLPFSEKCRRFFIRNVPHPTKSWNTLCLPRWFVYIFGGTYDSGNGYCSRPNIINYIFKYYQESWHKSGYTIWSWIFNTKRKNKVALHGFW
jgi:hypothetical protein